jgi:ATP-dependent DNA ligase
VSGARHPAVRPPVQPMAAKAVEQLPAGPGWSFEPKFDGFRALASAARAVCCCNRASCAI